MKVYLAGGISDTDRKEGQKRTAEALRAMGYEVYAASENNFINNKSNDPTPLDIYYGDVDRIKESDLFIVRISGGNEDGTLAEIGFVAGWNELSDNSIPILAYTTNERLIQPQFWHGIPSGGFNHLLAGMVDRWGKFRDKRRYVKLYGESIE